VSSVILLCFGLKCQEYIIWILDLVLCCLDLAGTPTIHTCDCVRVRVCVSCACVCVCVFV
jgi:hypothetical protein